MYLVTSSSLLSGAGVDRAHAAVAGGSGEVVASRRPTRPATRQHRSSSALPLGRSVAVLQAARKTQMPSRCEKRAASSCRYEGREKSAYVYVLIKTVFSFHRKITSS